MANGKQNGKQAKRKPRASRQPSRTEPAIRLSPAQEEALAAVTLVAIGILTALGAFNLSRGNILDGWTDVLGVLFGWGRYLAPFFFGGLGVWLLLDSLDLRPDIGGARPLGIALLFLILLTVLHITPEGGRGLDAASRGEGGGLIGYLVGDSLVGAIGVPGAFLVLFIASLIGLVLVFQISPRRMITLTADALRAFRSWWASLFNRLRHRAHAPRPENRVATPAAPELPERPPARVPRLDPAPPQPAIAPAGSPRSPVAARIIGGGEARASAHREWRLPNAADILRDTAGRDASPDEIRKRVRIIEQTLEHFGVPAKVTEVSVGPAITQFGVEPGFLKQKSPDGSLRETKVKVSRISALQHDLELALAAAPVRVEAPVPGKSIVGIEVPNEEKSNVSLRGVMESDEFKDKLKKSRLAIALGQNVSGEAIVADLGAMPHLLIAGATGSGKSVCINALIACLLITNTPDDIKFVMVDPKRVELSFFNEIPHLLTPVVVEMDLAVAALERAVAEMDQRFKMFAKVGARNIETYNQTPPEKRRAEGLPEAKLPYIVLIVDELADLMMVAADHVEKAITRLAQLARATGIHLVLATQRPSVDVVTGLIKANFPSRISFAVTSLIDSRVVLDAPGAETLLGRGDMLYMASDSSKLTRVQGCYVSDEELKTLVDYWKGFVEQATPPSDSSYPGGIIKTVPSDLPRLRVSPSSVVKPPEEEGEWVQGGLAWNLEPAPQARSEEDELLAQAIQAIRETDRASVSLLQRKLRIGYSRAAKLMELLEQKGYVGPDDGTPTKGRAVLAKVDLDPTPRSAEPSTPPPLNGTSRAQGPKANGKSSSQSRPRVERKFTEEDEDGASAAHGRPRAAPRDSAPGSDNDLDFSDFSEADWEDLGKE